MINVGSTLTLWILLLILILASVVWGIAQSKFSIQTRGAAFALALSATLLATLLPMELPDGFTPPRATWEPLRGFAEALGMVPDQHIHGMNQVWAIGNFFLMWPVVVTAWGFLRPRTLALGLVILVLSIETTQGVASSLGRTFELSDIVSNVLGGLVLMLGLRKLSKPQPR